MNFILGGGGYFEPRAGYIAEQGITEPRRRIGVMIIMSLAITLGPISVTVLMRLRPPVCSTFRAILAVGFRNTRNNLVTGIPYIQV